MVSSDLIEWFGRVVDFVLPIYPKDSFYWVGKKNNDFIMTSPNPLFM